MGIGGIREGKPGVLVLVFYSIDRKSNRIYNMQCAIEYN